MASISIQVRPSTGQLFQVELVPSSTTVEELKVIIATKMDNLDPSTLKLVFSGRILKNEDLCSDCSKYITFGFIWIHQLILSLEITAGCTVHVVRSGGNKAPVNKTATTTTTITSAPSTVNESIPPIPPTPSPSTLTGLGGASPFGDMQVPNMDPEVMRQMMDSPFMQNIMGNTGISN